MNSAKLGANKDRQSTSRTRIMQRIHNLGAHNIPTKHKNTYNSHGARRPPAPIQQQQKDPKAPRHNQTDHDQGAHNSPPNTSICTTARGHAGPPHRPNRPKIGNQANKTHAYVQPPEGRQAPRTNTTTAKGPAGPPQHPNRQQTGKTKPKQNTHIRTNTQI